MTLLRIAFVLCLWMSIECYGANQIVVPPDLATTPGNRTVGIALGSERLQMAYGSSFFGATGSPLEISEIRFRVNQNAPAFSNNTDMQVGLFTTTENIDAFRTTPFTGSQLFVARDRGRLAWSGNPGLSFDAAIPLPKHFIYDPSQGNLVVDLTIFDSGSDAMGFDAINRETDGMARIVAGSSSIWDSTGIITEFVVTQVPEPTTWLLLSIGIGFVMICRRTYVVA